MPAIKRYPLTLLLLAALLAGGTVPCNAFKGMGGSNADSQGEMGQPQSPSSDGGMGDMNVMEHEAERDATVAKVNGAPVTMGALMDSIMEVITVEYGNKEVTETIARQIRHDALEKLVLEELACQRAAAGGITVDPAFIEARIEARKTAAGSEEAFQKTLTEQNKTVADLERQIERFFLVKQLIDQEVTSKLSVSDDAIETIYQANRDQFADPEVVIITDVIFFLDPNEPASQEKVLQIKNKITDEFSGDPALLKEPGLLVRPHLSVSPAYRPLLYENARTMQQGAMSKPLVIDGTLHLLKLERYTPRKEQPEAQAKAFIASRLNSSQKKELLTKWRQELLANAEVEILSEMLK